MGKIWCKPLIILFIVGTLFTCIDPYSPKLDKFQSLLVVDALLTDENTSNYVRLSRTKKVSDEAPEMVSGALVVISDDLGNGTTLNEFSDGVYKTDSLIFRGETGRTYKLYIKTDEGDEYESESCLMYPVQNIDSIYFTKGQEITDNEFQEGITIYIDSKGESDCNFSRWIYEEWWKFKIPYPKLYNYVDEHTFIECSPIKKTCWGNNKSNEIIIRSSEMGNSKPILFIESGKSNRLSIQYCILVKQLSISKEEYEFWDQMRQINESGGDIFDKQPFQISGNIHNIRNLTEPVLGYFQVSAATIKMKYITAKEVNNLGLPSYNYECEKNIFWRSDYPTDPMNPSPPPTWNQIYSYFSNSDRIFLEPVLDGNGNLTGLVFSTPACSDCTLNGSLTKPDFWIDLN